MTPAEALFLGDRICDFLKSCGGAYENITKEVQENVFFALGSGQYIIAEDAGGIVYFASYWNISPEEVEAVMDRVKPLDISSGAVMYVSEAASRIGMRGIVDGLRKQTTGMNGIFWHRPVKKDSIHYFRVRQRKESRHGF